MRLLSFVYLFAVQILFPILLAGIGVLFFAITALREPSKADFAVFNLMVTHLLEGEHSLYYWGQQYGGSFPTWLMVPGFLLLGTDSLLGERLNSIVLMMLFYALLLTFVQRVWGRRVMYISAILLAFPSFRALFYYRNFTLWGTIALSVLHCIVSLYSRYSRKQYMYCCLLGIALGIGRWSSQQFIMYLLFVPVFFVITSTALGNLVSRITHKWKTYPYRLHVIVVAACTLFLGLGCIVAQIVSIKTVLFSIITLGSMAVFACSEEKKHTSIMVGLVLVGFLIGNAPQWIGNLFFDIKETHMIHFHYVTWRSVTLLITELWPIMWSPTGFGVQTMVIQIFSFVIFLLIAFSSCISMRRLWKLRTGIPLSLAQGMHILLVLLFFAPLLALILRGAENISHLRYIILAWPFGIVLIAIAIEFFVQRNRIVGVILCCMIVTVLAVPHLRALPHNVSRIPHSPVFTPGFSALEEYLVANDIRGGYSRYWEAYPMTFEMGERIIIAPFTGTVRYKPYQKTVRLQERFAVILDKKVYDIDAEHITKEVLLEAIQMRLRPTVEKKIRHASVTKRRSVGRWDVWILEH